MPPAGLVRESGKLSSLGMTWAMRMMRDGMKAARMMIGNCEIDTAWVLDEGKQCFGWERFCERMNGFAYPWFVCATQLRSRRLFLVG